MTPYNTQDKPTVQTMTPKVLSLSPIHFSERSHQASLIQGSRLPQGLCTCLRYKPPLAFPPLQAVNNQSFILISYQALCHTSLAFTD